MAPYGTSEGSNPPKSQTLPQYLGSSHHTPRTPPGTPKPLQHPKNSTRAPYGTPRPSRTPSPQAPLPPAAPQGYPGPPTEHPRTLPYSLGCPIAPQDPLWYPITSHCSPGTPHSTLELPQHPKSPPSGTLWHPKASQDPPQHPSPPPLNCLRSPQGPPWHPRSTSHHPSHPLAPQRAPQEHPMPTCPPKTPPRALCGPPSPTSRPSSRSCRVRMWPRALSRAWNSTWAWHWEEWGQCGDTAGVSGHRGDSGNGDILGRGDTMRTG